MSEVHRYSGHSCLTTSITGIHTVDEIKIVDTTKDTALHKITNKSHVRYGALLTALPVHVESVGEASFGVVVAGPCGGLVEGESADIDVEDRGRTSLGDDNRPCVSDAGG